MAIPDEMNAIVLERHDPDLRGAIEALRVARRRVNRPGRGQVLVRIEAAPCHPADLMFLQGRYGVRKTLPTVPGFEGAGVVVATGGGILGRWLANKRVACGVRGDSDGTWAEYAVVDSASCIPLPAGLDFAQGSTSLANPLTAVSLLDVIRKGGHAGVVQSAAAGQLGRMIRALALRAGLGLVDIVRKESQVSELEAAGAKRVLCSSHEDFAERLRDAARDQQATIALDAVAGRLTGLLLHAMPAGSTVLVYGALSGESCADIEPIDFIFGDKRLEAFEVANYLDHKSMPARLLVARRAQRLLLSGDFRTNILRQIGLDEARDGLLEYVDHMSDGKILFSP